jgi:hypothetical protein
MKHKRSSDESWNNVQNGMVSSEVRYTFQGYTNISARQCDGVNLDDSLTMT